MTYSPVIDSNGQSSTPCTLSIVRLWDSSHSVEASRVSAPSPYIAHQHTPEILFCIQPIDSNSTTLPDLPYDFTLISALLATTKYMGQLERWFNLINWRISFMTSNYDTYSNIALITFTMPTSYFQKASRRPSITLFQTDEQAMKGIICGMCVLYINVLYPKTLSVLHNSRYWCTLVP